MHRDLTVQKHRSFFRVHTLMSSELRFGQFFLTDVTEIFMHVSYLKTSLFLSSCSNMKMVTYFNLTISRAQFLTQST